MVRNDLWGIAIIGGAIILCLLVLFGCARQYPEYPLLPVFPPCEYGEPGYVSPVDTEAP